MVPSTPTTLKIPQPKPESTFDSRVEGAFGDWVGETPGETQLKFRKELVNKIAWVLGTAYGKTYSGKKSAVQAYAQRIVTATLRDHGYKN